MRKHYERKKDNEINSMKVWSRVEMHHKGHWCHFPKVDCMNLSELDPWWLFFFSCYLIIVLLDEVWRGECLSFYLMLFFIPDIAVFWLLICAVCPVLIFIGTSAVVTCFSNTFKFYRPCFSVNVFFPDLLTDQLCS